MRDTEAKGFVIYPLNTSRSRIEAWVSANQSGSITPNSAALAAGVLDMTEMLEGFALRLRELRRAKGLSQVDLGEQAGLHYSHIGRYERGTSRPSGDSLKRMTDVLAVTGDYLLEGAADAAGKARFEDRDLLRHFQEVQQLPEDDKHVVKKLLDAFLTKKQLQALAR